MHILLKYWSLYNCYKLIKIALNVKMHINPQQSSFVDLKLEAPWSLNVAVVPDPDI